MEGGLDWVGLDIFVDVDHQGLLKPNCIKCLLISLLLTFL